MKVGLTHSARALPGLDERLRELGFMVEWQPLIETRSILDGETRRLAAALLKSDWLVFPSRSAVRAWVDLGLPLASTSSARAAAGGSRGFPRAAAVGYGTAAELEAAGGRADLVGAGDAHSTARAVLRATRRGANVGLVQGDIARPTLGRMLSEQGRRVSAVTIYRTDARRWLGPVADVTVLASPSGANAFGPELLGRTRCVTVGHVTAAEVRRLGAHALVARSPDVAGVLRAVSVAAAEQSLEVT